MRYSFLLLVAISGTALCQTSSSARSSGTSLVQLRARTVVVDTQTHTAALLFLNTLDTTAVVAPTLMCVPAVPERPCAIAAWVTDWPKGFRLAPHDSQTVTIHLHIPPDAPEDSAHVAVRVSRFVSAPGMPDGWVVAEPLDSVPQRIGTIVYHPKRGAR